MEAAIHNTKILEKHNYDLEKAIEAQGFTNLSMGAELRPSEQLEPLLRHHPNFNKLEEIIQQGVRYPQDDLTEDKRIQEVNEQLEKGNQKSALEEDALPIVTKAFADDIKKGYAIIVTKDCLKNLKDAEVYPLGMQHQATINERGEIIPKKRLTHNLSNKKKEKISINQRIREDELPETIYGHAIHRFLHKIHCIRFHNPNEPILCAKNDIDKAYRRLHTHPKISSKCCATWYLHKTNEKDELIEKSETEVGSILNRLPFGSSPGPTLFSQYSETTFDLAEDLMLCKEWNTDELKPPMHEQVPTKILQPKDEPYGQALQADVDLPSNTKGGCEGYIDDCATAVLATEDNKEMVERARLCNLLSLHLICRPNAGNKEPILRPPIASLRKLLAEGGQKESIIFLGWFINTRAFTIGLPADKTTAWIKSITDTIQSPKSDYEHLGTLVGRLEHVCNIIPAARHFMNRLRRIKDKAFKYNTAKITKESKKDLLLWIKLLRRAEKGISINNVIFRQPTSVPLTDASEIGIGGYSLTSNKLWRYEFSIDEQRAFTLNVKEYIASVIGALLAMEEDKSEHPCILSLSDSSSTVSWLHKSNHDPQSSPVHNDIARWHAQNQIVNDACDYSQHVKGSENLVADALSRDFHLSDEKLLSLLQATVPHLLPPKPQIISLNSQITSWITSLAPLAPKKRELVWGLTPSTLAAGVAGWNSANDQKSQTPIWKNSPPSINPVSYAPSWMPSETGPSQRWIPLKEKPLDRPWTMWQRPSQTVVGKTQD